MSRLPIRLRLALASSVAMALVISTLGALVYLRLGDSLLEQVDDGLEGLAARASAGDDPGTEIRVEEGFVQAIRADGRLAWSFGGIDSPAVSKAEQRRAEARPFFLTLPLLAGMDGPVRLHVSSEQVNGELLVIVAGASLEDRQEALDGLVAQLVVIGPLALLLSSLAGYFLAGAALRPVEAMRRRAAGVSSERSGQRLPLSPADDEIRRLGETLNDMLARLEAGLVRERRFVADASHELRTPLSLLQTELELALRRPRSGDEKDRALRSAAEEVDRLVRLAEDLLVLARADEGKLPLDLSEHVARDVLDAVAGRFDSRARVTGRLLEVDAAPDLMLSGDRLRLEQAIGNLVDNALRHGAGTIRLTAGASDGPLHVAVTDEGPGFPNEFLPHAFERFSRDEAARGEGDGAGLGLAIVDAIARAHGGSAVVTNRAGGVGAEITLRLPAHPRLM